MEGDFTQNPFRRGQSVKSRFIVNNAQANPSKGFRGSRLELRELHFFCPCEGDWRAISFY
jgi:hypothetical protein